MALVHRGWETGVAVAGAAPHDKQHQIALVLTVHGHSMAGNAAAADDAADLQTEGHDCILAAHVHDLCLSHSAACAAAD